MKYRVESNPHWLEMAKDNGRKATLPSSTTRVPSTYVALGQVHELTGNHDLAIQEFQRAVSLDPRAPGAIAGMANSYKTRDTMRDAEAAYIKAAALRPDDWTGYDDLGIFYESIGRQSDAIVQFKQPALELTADNSWPSTTWEWHPSVFDDPKMLRTRRRRRKRSL